jgi:hypothetical protein
MHIICDLMVAVDSETAFRSSIFRLIADLFSAYFSGFRYTAAKASEQKW